MIADGFINAYLGVSQIYLSYLGCQWVAIPFTYSLLGYTYSFSSGTGTAVYYATWTIFMTTQLTVLTLVDAISCTAAGTPATMYLNYLTITGVTFNSGYTYTIYLTLNYG